jgi:CRP-like cAMP-binding protein
MSGVSPVKFRKGDTLFHQGEVSDCALRLNSGELEILREVDGASILLGRVGAGEWVGEMGVIENRPRSATARATADGEAETLTAVQFLDRVSRDPALARELILRLSIRLRTIEDQITSDPVGFASPHKTAEAPDTTIAENTSLSFAATTDALRARIGTGPFVIRELPFVVGRSPVRGEAKPPRELDLVIEDEQPFRLSREHFMIKRSSDQLLVWDLGSTLGTIVNDQAIGHHFSKDAAPLRRGENCIVAGGWHSPFAFSVSVT